MKIHVCAARYYPHNVFSLLSFARTAVIALRGRAALTDGAHVPAVRCHHERRSACAVGRVHLRAVAQQQLQALHMVGEGCSMQGRPGGATSTQLVLKKGNFPTSPKTSKCKRFYLFPYQIRVIAMRRL